MTSVKTVIQVEESLSHQGKATLRGSFTQPCTHGMARQHLGAPHWFDPMDSEWEQVGAEGMLARFQIKSFY